MNVANFEFLTELMNRVGVDGRALNWDRVALTVKNLSGASVTPAINVADAAAYAVLAANSGKIHLVRDQAQDITITLPAAAAGLYYEFWSTMIAADDFDWIINTGADANFFLGGINWIDSDVAEATASEVTLVAPDGNSNSKLQVNLPSVNTIVRAYCDGTNWFLTGQVFSTTAPAFSDQ